MRDNIVFEHPAKLDSSKDQVFDKKVLLISDNNNYLGLARSFTRPEILRSVKGLCNLVQLPCERQPDAVLYYVDTVNEEILGNVRYANEILKKCSVPLVVIGSKFSEKTKKSLLKNGADDVFSETINAESLTYWINFLKLFKKLSKEKTSKLQIEPFKYKISFQKRIFDIIMSASALLFLSPIILIIGIIIKLESRGPVFYISKRAGKGYRIFNFYKFRSMADGAEKDLSKLMHLNQYGGGEIEVKDKSVNPVFFKVKDDPRITTFGKFLRNTSLDEIPQLINVLKGEMSIVGNRPLPLYEAQKLTKDQCAMRFMSAAGITGLWQVEKRGKSEMSEEERIELDTSYAINNSFTYDISLILRTFPALLQKEKV